MSQDADQLPHSDRGQRDVRTSATDTEVETDIVDLSNCGLEELMALRDPLVVGSLDALVRHVTERAATLKASGGDDSPYFTSDCGGDPA